MKTVVAGALGKCVHVAGVMNFLRLAEAAGWQTVFLGPAVPVEEFLKAVRREKADMVGVSYRLTPETGERLLADFVTGLRRGLSGYSAGHNRSSRHGLTGCQIEEGDKAAGRHDAPGDPPLRVAQGFYKP